MTGDGTRAGAVVVRAVEPELAGGNGVTPTRLFFATGGGTGVTPAPSLFPGAGERNQFSGFSLFKAPVFSVDASAGAGATGVPIITGSGCTFTTCGEVVAGRGGFRLARATVCVRDGPAGRTALMTGGVLVSGAGV